MENPIVFWEQVEERRCNLGLAKELILVASPTFGRW